MQIGALTGYIDVAQIVLYAFWLFFAGLIYYLLRENRREGYPTVTAGGVRVDANSPMTPKPKTFLMHDGSKVSVPRFEAYEQLNAVYTSGAEGSPLVPLGDPLLAAMGPSAYAQRADVPDLTFDDNLPKIVPLRAASAFFLAWEDPDVRGFDVLGSDGVVAGTVVEAWIDRSEVVVRYLEVKLALPGADHSVLLPMNMLAIQRKLRRIRTDFITGTQFAFVPKLAHPDIVTLLEEDKIMAFYAGGSLYATASRTEPLL